MKKLRDTLQLKRRDRKKLMKRNSVKRKQQLLKPQEELLKSNAYRKKLIEKPRRQKLQDR